jgi:hypothetical protein
MRSDSRTDKGSAAEGRANHSEPTALPAPDSKSGEPLKHTDEPLRLVHHHPGYLRVRADAFLHAQDDNPVVTAARSAAESVPGFRSWALNPKTGSVVIQYEPGTVEPDDLLKHIAKCAGFRGVEIAIRKTMNRQEAVSAFLDTIESINRVFGELTGGRADLRELAPVALAATSVVSFILGPNRGRWPEWSGALYHGYRVFLHWHRPEVRTRERIGRQEDERAGAADETIDEGS